MSKSEQGTTFEKRVAKMFEDKGFSNVRLTPSSNDGGIDIFMYKGVEKCGVECKDHEKPIGRPVIQKFHSALLMNEMKYGYIVVSSTFSQQAIEYAGSINNRLAGLHIELVNGKKLEFYEREIIEARRIEERRRTAEERHRIRNEHRIREKRRIEEESRINKTRRNLKEDRVNKPIENKKFPKLSEEQKTNELNKSNTLNNINISKINRDQKIEEENRIDKERRVRESRLKEIRKINEAIRINEECKINKIRRKNGARIVGESSKDLAQSESTWRTAVLICCFVFVLYIFILGS